MTKVKSHMHTFSSVDMVYIFLQALLEKISMVIMMAGLTNFFNLYRDCMDGLHY